MNFRPCHLWHTTMLTTPAVMASLSAMNLVWELLNVQVTSVTSFKAVVPICVGFFSEQCWSWSVGIWSRTAMAVHRCTQKIWAGWPVDHPFSGVLHRVSELSRQGLVSQEQCEVKQHRGAGCTCSHVCEQNRALQDSCGGVIQPGNSSYRLGEIQWLRHRDGGRVTKVSSHTLYTALSTSSEKR